MRRPLDAYYTPDALATALVGLLPIPATATVLEPHAGGGAFVRALRGVAGAVLACDVDPESAGLALADASWPIDFLSMREAADWAVGNPPFRNFAAHVDHALDLSPNVAFLLRLAAMETKARVPLWNRWPLRRVWVLAERPSFTGGDTDKCAYGFFWFDRDWLGDARVTPGWSWRGA